LDRNSGRAVMLWTGKYSFCGLFFIAALAQARKNWHMAVIILQGIP
jgi:hypothetical protein